MTAVSQTMYKIFCVLLSISQMFNSYTVSENITVFNFYSCACLLWETKIFGILHLFDIHLWSKVDVIKSYQLATANKIK